MESNPNSSQQHPEHSGPFILGLLVAWMVDRPLPGRAHVDCRVPTNYTPPQLGQGDGRNRFAPHCRCVHQSRDRVLATIHPSIHPYAREPTETNTTNNLDTIGPTVYPCVAPCMYIQSTASQPQPWGSHYIYEFVPLWWWWWWLGGKCVSI